MLGTVTHRPITSVLWEAQTAVFLQFLSGQLNSRFSETLSQMNKVENNTTIQYSPLPSIPYAQVHKPMHIHMSIQQIHDVSIHTNTLLMKEKMVRLHST